MSRKDCKTSTRQQFFIDGNRREWQFPTANKKKAAFAKQMVNRLAESRKTNLPDAEALAWAMELDDRMYEKLVLWGLVEEKERRWTLADLLERFMESQTSTDRATLNKFVQTQSHLRMFFGEHRELATITFDEADKFRQWLATEPLNSRGKGQPVPYSEATVNRRTNVAKQIFAHAIRLGMLEKSPFQFLRGGESVNEERWEYIEAERVLKVIAECPSAQTRTIIALIRFCGLRGASELYSLTWNDINWSTATTDCRILVHGTKNRRHKKGTRWVPIIHPVVEQCLSELFEITSEKQSRLFPTMTAKSNPGVVVEKAVQYTPGVIPWQVPLYNMRKSFCCDMFGRCSDPKFYEHVCDHSYTTAMKHYQILYPDRLQNGFDSLKNPLHHPKVPQEKPRVNEPKIIRARKSQSETDDSEDEKLPQNLPHSSSKVPQNLPQQGLHIFCRYLQERPSESVKTGVSSTSCSKKRVLAISREDSIWPRRDSRKINQMP